MQVHQRRFCFGDDSTLSLLEIDYAFKCFILEDQVREGPKIPGETAIDYGTYPLELRTEGGFHQRYSQRFSDDPVIEHVGMIHFLDVPDFTFVQLHPGNDDEHTEGCPLTGLNPVRRDDGQNNHNIDRATDAYRIIYPVISQALLRGEPVRYHIDRVQ